MLKQSNYPNFWQTQFLVVERKLEKYFNFNFIFYRYFEKSGSKEIPLIRAVVNGDWSQVINCVSI